MKKRVDDLEFCRVWQESDSRQEVAEKLKLAPNTVYLRGKMLIGLGVRLKELKRSSGKEEVVDVAGLNAMIEKT